jgi:hypothetical protein
VSRFLAGHALFYYSEDLFLVNVQGLMKIKRNIQATGKRFVLLLAMLAVTGGLLHSQHSLTLGQKLSCESSSLLLPLDVSGFENVGSFTIYIQIDTLQVTFDGIANPHSLLSSGMLLNNFIETTSSIVLTWFSVGGITISDGTLLELKLDYVEGLAGLVFSASSELADPEGTIIENAVYTDGMVMPALQILLQPQPITVTEGESAFFEVELQHNDEHTFQWQQDDGNGWINLSDDMHFAGANASMLNIDSVPLGFNNSEFRCVINFDNCSAISSAATLTVSPLTVINTGSTGQPSIRAWPNPVTTFLHYEIDQQVGNYKLIITNSKGEIVMEMQEFEQKGVADLSSLKPGLYFLQPSVADHNRQAIRIIKM